MILALRQAKVYLRAAALAAVLVAVAAVLFQNRNNAVGVWFFGLTDETKPVNVVWLLLSTASCTLVVARVLSFGWGVVRELREVTRLETEKKSAAERKRRATELDERERKLDEKLKQALEGNDHEDDHSNDNES
jgi:hypothetical protein